MNNTNVKRLMSACRRDLSKRYDIVLDDTSPLDHSDLEQIKLIKAQKPHKNKVVKPSIVLSARGIYSGQ